MDRQLRNTAQRHLVYEIVLNDTSHPTADDIYEKARERERNISRGTVYRNLSVLSETGSIRRLSMPVGPDHFDFNLKAHYHFCCRRCHMVTDASVPYMDKLSDKELEQKGYVVEGKRLILIGLCPECAGSVSAEQNK